MEIPKVFIYGVQIHDKGQSKPPYVFSADIVFIDRSSNGLPSSVYQLKGNFESIEELKKNNETLMIGEVLSIDRKNKKIFLSDGNIVCYNHLILVTDSQKSLLNEQNLSTALKALSDALKMQSQIPHLFQNLTLLDSRDITSNFGQISALDPAHASYQLKKIVWPEANLLKTEINTSLDTKDHEKLFEIVI